MQNEIAQGVFPLSASAQENISVSEQAPTFYVPMIRLEQARDYYRVSFVMPRIEWSAEWAVFDRGRLRLSVPPIRYGEKGTGKPGFLRWISLPNDVDQGVAPIVDYSSGCLRILIARKGWKV